MGNDPKVPRMTVEAMLKMATENFSFFCEIALQAGHKNAENFLSILQTSVERKKALAPKTYSAYSVERFRFEPDPQLDERFHLLEEEGDELALRATRVYSSERKRVLSKMQDAYKQAYERELHVLVYGRVSQGEPLMQAYHAVKKEFHDRADRLVEFGNMPRYVREAQAKAMKGSYGSTVTGTPDVFGPSEVFGELGIQSNRTDLFSFAGPGSGLTGGRRYWPRGNPDNSCDE